jgi:ABC-type polysaccharide/polyol phosphate export permease
VLTVLRYRALLRNLVLKDLKLKYQHSVLGFTWSLLNPFLMLTVYTVAFKYILQVPTPNYAHFLLAGLLPWNFFASSVTASTQSITANARLIRQVPFPHETLPIATVAFALVQFLVALGVLLPLLALFSDQPLRWTVLLLPLVLATHFAFTVGLAFLLAAGTVFFRDVTHLVEVLLPALFWTAPIVYPLTMVPAPLQLLFQLNPLVAFAVAYQDVLFWGRLPDPWIVTSALLWALAAVAVGHALFRRHSVAFAEEV